MVPRILLMTTSVAPITPRGLDGTEIQCDIAIGCKAIPVCPVSLCAPLRSATGAAGPALNLAYPRPFPILRPFSPSPAHYHFLFRQRTSPLALQPVLNLRRFNSSLNLNPHFLPHILRWGSGTIFNPFTSTFAKAFPEKTFFRTMKGLPASGSATAPDTRPAFSRADSLGAMALPSTLFEKMITFAPVLVATCAITLVNTCASK